MQKHHFRKPLRNALQSRNRNGYPHVIRRLPFWIRDSIVIRYEKWPSADYDELCFSQRWKIYHEKGWVIIGDHYCHNHQWVLELGNEGIISFWGGKCLYRSKKLDAKLLFKVLKLFFDNDPGIRNVVPDYLITNKKYKDFLKGYEVILKTVSTING